jgi:hypothetical protein
MDLVANYSLCSRLRHEPDPTYLLDRFVPPYLRAIMTQCTVQSLRVCFALELMTSHPHTYTPNSLFS